uniref:Uncharacterized protein n=1 Tax=Glossina austeni TaxID=7395 RepID=A0A1A9VRG6_GLOAU
MESVAAAALLDVYFWSPGIIIILKVSDCAVISIIQMARNCNGERNVNKAKDANGYTYVNTLIFTTCVCSYNTMLKMKCKAMYVRTPTPNIQPRQYTVIGAFSQIVRCSNSNRVPNASEVAYPTLEPNFNSAKRFEKTFQRRERSLPSTLYNEVTTDAGSLSKSARPRLS